ncbi:uncharacterized protein DDB_G0282077-like [Chanodichthys erythropterus]|uniref:uncharacterized protein DDB_G0282077-like n=1 Tax=Chanodichthys erythropterus TaxID=933992 RepID=UPI00351F46C7
MTDQGGDSGTREPGGATRSSDPGGADWSSGRDGAKGSESGGGATGSSSAGAADDCLTYGSTSQQGISRDGTGLQTSSSSGAGGLAELFDNGGDTRLYMMKVGGPSTSAGGCHAFSMVEGGNFGSWSGCVLGYTLSFIKRVLSAPLIGSEQ